MKVRVKKRFIFKRANVKVMFSFKASLWSGPGSEGFRCSIDEFEHSPFEAFFAEISEEGLCDWAHGAGHATVRECLQKEPMRRHWVFKAHEPAPAPRRTVFDTSCALMGALDHVYDDLGFGGRDQKKEPKRRLSRIDERKLDKMLDTVSAWWLGHTRMVAPYYHTVKRFKIDNLDALEILEKFKPEWLDGPIVTE